MPRTMLCCLLFSIIASTAFSQDENEPPSVKAVREMGAEIKVFGNAITIRAGRPLNTNSILMLGVFPADRLRIELVDCPMSDESLFQWRNYPKFESVKLPGCTVTDTCFVHLGTLPNLQTLDLSRTAVTGRGLIYMSKCESLKSLSLWSTNLNNDTSKYLRAVPSLTELVVARTAIDNRGVDNLRFNTRLTELNLSSTRIDRDGSLGTLARSLPDLESLYVHDTHVDDSLIDAVIQFPLLTDLILYDTKVTSEGLKKLADYLKQGHLPRLSNVVVGRTLGDRQPQLTPEIEQAVATDRQGTLSFHDQAPFSE